MPTPDDKHPHLWIPENEIINVEHKPTSRSHDLPIHHGEHGLNLLKGLDNIDEFHRKQDSSLGDEVVVFKVKLQENEKFNNKQRQALLENNKIHINALKDIRTAIVSSKTQDIVQFKSKVRNYQLHKSTPDLQFVESIEPFVEQDKQSRDIKGLLSKDILTEELLDVQIQLVPKLEPTLYPSAIEHIKSKIEAEGGQFIREPYTLSDGTPVIRVEIQPSSLNYISADEAILRLERTNFFLLSPSAIVDLPAGNIPLIGDIDVNSLPIVTVLDSGVDFSQWPALENLILQHWTAPGVQVTHPTHGTAAASRVIFGGNIDKQVEQGAFEPRARVIDACISNDQMISEDVFIERVKAVVTEFSEISKVYNLSFNARIPIDSDAISILAYELDVLMLRNEVQFIISAGNHQIWRAYDSLEEVLDDDETRISTPAESFLGITVGSITSENAPDSMSGKHEISPFSRIGPGFARNQKPDLVAYGGNAPTNEAPAIGTQGSLIKIDGTSFSAPVVAGDYATVLASMPDYDLLLAKALLIHSAEPLWEQEGLGEEEIAYYAKLYGNGHSSPERALNSSDSRVTFVCKGELNRLTKQRVNFWMPDVLSALPGRNTARVTVTCVSQPPIDRTKGEEYLGAFVSASLHKVDSLNRLVASNPKAKTGRTKWQPWQHFSRLFSTFNPGDWQIWLQLFTRWEIDDDQNIPYALAITIEDPSGEVPVYQAIQDQVAHRFRPMTEVRLRVR